MRATVEYLQESFAKYNELCFGGKLPPVEMRLSRARTFLGRMEYRRLSGPFRIMQVNSDFLIKISIFRDLPQDELDDVIIHEMIHYYIARFNVKDRSAHGPVFRAMMADINSRFGRNITISRRRDWQEPSDSRPARPRIVCVSELEGAEFGVTVCASTRVLKIKRDLPRMYRIRSSRWYCSSDPYLGRYPRSNTARIYRIPAAELQRVIDGAAEMKFAGKELVPVK